MWCPLHLASPNPSHGSRRTPSSPRPLQLLSSACHSRVCVGVCCAGFGTLADDCTAQTSGLAASKSPINGVLPSIRVLVFLCDNFLSKVTH